MKISEYVFICLLTVCIAFVIGMSIIKLIDSKMSNVSINIPKIMVPKSDVIIKLSKQCTNKPYEIEHVQYDESESDTLESFTTPNNYVSEPIAVPVPSQTIPTKTPKNKKSRKKKYNNEYEEYYDYLTLGCRNSKSKNNINVTNVQLACSDTNTSTSETYYNDNFEYPVIPHTDEHNRWIPADYVDTNYMANATVYHKISNGKRPKNSVPFASNYIF